MSIWQQFSFGKFFEKSRVLQNVEAERKLRLKLKERGSQGKWKLF
jgi:hypothetical protein